LAAIFCGGLLALLPGQLGLIQGNTKGKQMLHINEERNRTGVGRRDLEITDIPAEAKKLLGK
jgi:hypothetical protein